MPPNTQHCASRICTIIGIFIEKGTQIIFYYVELVDPSCCSGIS